MRPSLSAAHAHRVREFILRGNVVDLAVGIVIGATLGSVVTSLTADIVTPLLGSR